MFETGFDKAKNLLRISFWGHVTAEEAKQGTHELAVSLVDTESGFRLLTDLTGLERMDRECVPHISDSMDLLNKKGVAMVVRVIPDAHKDIGFSILSLFHYRHDIQIITCQTLEEAMEALAD